MTTKTPSKNSQNLEPNKSFSPVILHESPAAVSPQKNLTGLPRVARDIAADVYNNIQYWNDYHIKGALTCKNIALLKTDHPRIYPDGVEDLTNELYNIVQKLKEITNALECLLSQMNSLVKLHKISTPLFISLTSNQLAQLVGHIVEAYKAELKVKECVLENIAHSKNKDETMFYATLWTYQQNITSDVNLSVECLLTETGYRKIN